MIKKLLLLLITCIFLSACAQSTALIGPAITVGNTGNIMQASFSYGSNLAVKEATGMTPGEHVSSYVGDRKEEKKLKKDLLTYRNTNISLLRQKHR